MTKSYGQVMITPEFDVANSGYPDIKYAIVGSPRSGTNLLCDLLFQMGYGVPMEYVNSATAEVMMKRLDTPTPGDYAKAVVNLRTTSNGVFGVKCIMPTEWARVVELFWVNRVIRIIREDRDAQARSFARAVKTQYWCDIGDPDDRPVAVSVEDDEVGKAAAILQQYETFYEQNIATPHILISYEYLVSQKKEALRAIAKDVFQDAILGDWEPPRARIRKLPSENGVVDLKGLA